MEFIARVRGIDVVCKTPEELDFVVDRYGDKDPGKPVGGSGAKTVNGASSNDTTLLKAFLTSGSDGVSPSTIGSLLDRAVGRGMPFALKSWGVRMGLATEEGESAAFREDGGGYHLTAGAKAVVKLKYASLLAGGEGPNS